MPTRPDASSAPQKQSVKLIAAVAVIGLFGALGAAALAIASPEGASLRRWGYAALAVASFVVAVLAHRRLRRVRWTRLVEDD